MPVSCQLWGEREGGGREKDREGGRGRERETGGEGEIEREREREKERWGGMARGREHYVRVTVQCTLYLYTHTILHKTRVEGRESGKE